RCFSCRKVVRDQRNAYISRVIRKGLRNALVILLMNSDCCCRPMALTHVDSIVQLLHYNRM
ncbi:hypothetical protein L218DRAFT_846329, partial [Marasmius fiardii PR-910]